MEVLGKLVNLTVLNLDNGEVTDAGLQHLSELKQLVELSLDNTHITDKSVPVLRGLQKLQRLNLYHTFLTPGANAELKSALPGCLIIFDKESSRPNRRRS
jgi:hypothetical protein